MTDKPITSFADASEHLSRFYVNSSGKYTLDNMHAIMQFLDNPQDKFKAIHVAGTSGKTSTVYYMSALLAATGKKVGLTVSPHVDHLNERLQINNQPLPEKEFCNALDEFLNLIEKGNFSPSWFEVMIAFVYWYFAKAKVDYAVIEVGLGGLLDGTNVISRSDKVCVITDIGLDHTDVLGDTLPEIAGQKIGIVQSGNVVFTYQQPDEIMEVFKKWCVDHKATLKIADQQSLKGTENLPAFQLRNWQLAYEIYKYVSNRDNLQHLTSQVLVKTQHVQVPGRMDIRQVGSKTLIMDGAHNAQKMTVFLDSFKELYPNTKPAILMSFKEGKDYKEAIPLLKPIASRFIITSFEANQDVPSNSMDLKELEETFQKEGLKVSTIVDQHEAYLELVNGPENVCIITGSFYLLGQIRHNEHLT